MALYRKIIFLDFACQAPPFQVLRGGANGSKLFSVPDDNLTETRTISSKEEMIGAFTGAERNYQAKSRKRPFGIEEKNI